MANLANFGRDEDGNDRAGRVMSLSTLQSLMRKDPEAYETEFNQQWLHFESMLEIFKLKPQKPYKTFSEQVMFLGHVVPSFPKKGNAFPGLIIMALTDHFQVMHSEMRQTLVTALIMLRNRDQFPLLTTLPLYFKMFALQDKNLRKAVFTHIVKDLVQMHQGSVPQRTRADLKDFFFSQLQESENEIARRSCAIFISMYRQNVWRDAHVVNLVSAGLLHPDVKISAALVHLFLGNKTKGLEGILDETDEEEANTGAIQGLLGSKQTARRQKRIKRAKKSLLKAKNRSKKAHKNDSSVSFIAIDLLNDPQTLAERCLQRIQKGSDPFNYRLLLLHLVARLVGRHSLFLLNIYPFLMKYIVPTQNDVTQILACLVEASHAQVPPEELRPIILHIMQTFVTESAAPEVIEVGLNTIREVCSRAVGMLNEEELGDLVAFKKFKNKGVMIAAHSLINVYREIDPQLLHRSLRGREATMALSRGELQAPQYGAAVARDDIDGLELLAKSRKSDDPDRKRRRKGEDGEFVADKDDAKEMMSKEVLSSDDFKKMRKLQLQKSVELQLGRKRTALEMESSSDDESGEIDAASMTSGDEESDDDERGLSGRMPDFMSAGQLKGHKKRGRSKAERMRGVEEGRTDFKAILAERHSTRKGSTTNKEKRRNKPLMMTKQSAGAQGRKNATSSQKMSNLKSHIKTLQKTVGGKAKRRRG